MRKFLFFPLLLWCLPAHAYTLYWQSNPPRNEDGFAVEYRLGQTDTWGPYGTTARGVMQCPLRFNNTRQWCFRVRAYNDKGETLPSEIVCITPQTSDLTDYIPQGGCK